MACYLTLYAIFILSILIIIPYIESSQCSKKCTFQGLQLNSSLSSIYAVSSNDSHDNIDRYCVVKLKIDFIKGFVNVEFDARTQWSKPQNRLDFSIDISLNDTIIQSNFFYECFMSDYCDIEFMHKILLLLTAIKMQSLRQKLVTRLYDSIHTGPAECLRKYLCLQNKSFCWIYIPENSLYAIQNNSRTTCVNPVERSPSVKLSQPYPPETVYPEEFTDSFTFNCNTPNCGSTKTIIEIFELLTHEYIHLLENLVINLTKTNTRSCTTKRSTTTSIKESTTATSNYALLLFRHFNILYFLIISFSY